MSPEAADLEAVEARIWSLLEPRRAGARRGYHVPMPRSTPPTLEQRVRLHCWELFDGYEGDLDAVAGVACSHGGHEARAEVLACLCSEIITEVLTKRQNRELILAAIVASQEAA